MVYFFSKEEKSNSLDLTDCVNAFAFCFVLLFFFRLAGILKLRKIAGESSTERFFLLLFFYPCSFLYIKSAVFVGLENFQSKSGWVPQALFTF